LVDRVGLINAADDLAEDYFVEFVQLGLKMVELCALLLQLLE
jgi:hypothetical protein